MSDPIVHVVSSAVAQDGQVISLYRQNDAGTNWSFTAKIPASGAMNGKEIRGTRTSYEAVHLAARELLPFMAQIAALDEQRAALVSEMHVVAARREQPASHPAAVDPTEPPF
jgi:hypothetical protein